MCPNMKTLKNIRIFGFDTNIGPCAVAFKGEEIAGLQLPLKTQKATLTKLAGRFDRYELPEKQTKWESSIISRIQTHLLDGSQNFSQLKLNIESTPFFSRVYETVQKIPSGHRMTYGEVAKKLGVPQGARAVGQAMARNPIPLVVPCHRVIGSSGKMTGFSAMDGIKLKMKLLELEQKT